jgi:hypothetical protein
MIMIMKTVSFVDVWGLGNIPQNNRVFVISKVNQDNISQVHNVTFKVQVHNN